MKSFKYIEQAEELLKSNEYLKAIDLLNKAIQANECRLRRRSSSRFPSLTPTRVSFEPGTSAVARVTRVGAHTPLVTASVSIDY